MNRELTRFLGFLAAVAAVLLTLAVFGARFWGAAGGADGAIITHLKKLERDGVDHSLPWARLLGPKLQFERISVLLDADGEGATVTSTLDFTGELRRPGLLVPTRVSSLGLERARYRRVDGRWQPQSTDFPRLLSILETLERRRLSLERGEALPDGGVPYEGVTRRVYQGLAWYIRSERSEVLVSEDYRFQGESPSRPVDEKATRRLSLLEESSGLFSFPDGIM